MKTLILTVLAVVMGLGFVGNAFAAKGAKGAKSVFVSLGDDKKSIKVTTGGKNNPMEATITVDEKTVVTIDGAAATLSDLKAGHKLTISPATGTAETITAVSGKKAK